MAEKKLYITNLDSSPIERLRIQTVPEAINIDPVSNWNAIPSIGRNNPFYHYTGGEDEIRFVLDWYSNTDNRRDVIEACRWVESLTRNDSYNSRAPRVHLAWGDLYKYSEWIVFKAPYELKFFEQGSGLLPIQAFQRVSLKKVSDENTSKADIRDFQ